MRVGLPFLIPEGRIAVEKWRTLILGLSLLANLDLRLMIALGTDGILRG